MVTYMCKYIFKYIERKMTGRVETKIKQRLCSGGG